MIYVLADKVHKKADNINDRRNANRDRALQQMEKLKDQLQLHQFLQVTCSLYRMQTISFLSCFHMYGLTITEKFPPISIRPFLFS